MSKSAFPHGMLEPWNQEEGQYDGIQPHPGMSLHTWQWTQFAKHPPAIPKGLVRPEKGWGHKAAIDLLVEWSFLYADAMMAALAEREQGGRDD